MSQAEVTERLKTFQMSIFVDGLPFIRMMCLDKHMDDIRLAER